MKKYIYKYYQFLIHFFFLWSGKKKVYRVHAIRRSGQHAILDWMKNNIDTSYYFYNNVYANNHLYYSSDTREVYYRPFKKKSTIYNIENSLFNAHYGSRYNSEKGVGKYNEFTSVLMIRDPFNLFSSYLHAKWPWDTYFNDHEGYRKFIVDIWKIHAKEYLRETNYLKNLVTVNYNTWVTDLDYRKEVAQRLSMTTYEKESGRKLEFGLGSSFSDSKEEKNYMNRWRKSISDPIYKDIFKDKELIELSIKIFGVIEGTEILYEN